MSRVRPAVFADRAGIEAVQMRQGLGGLDEESWNELCHNHPARHEYPGFPPGWVLESDSGEIAGSLINIPLPLELEGRRVRAVGSGSWGVDEQHRSLTALNLMFEWLRQPNASMWLVGSANSTATKVFERFRMLKIPMPHYQDALFWITDPVRFAAAVLRKKKVPGSPLLAWPAGLALAARNFSRRRSFGGSGVSITTIPAFDGRFDEFWERLRNDIPRVRILRTASMLQWRYKSASARKGVRILLAERGPEMVGYAVLISRPREHLGLQQYIVSDLQALKDDQDVLRALLDASSGEARRDGRHALEFAGYCPAKREAALSLSPMHYQYPGWPLFYRCAEQALHARLGNSGDWDFCHFDAF